MIVEVTLNEKEVNKLLEKAIKEKMSFSDDMKLVDTRSYSGVYVFDDAKIAEEDESDEQHD